MPHNLVGKLTGSIFSKISKNNLCAWQIIAYCTPLFIQWEKNIMSKTIFNHATVWETPKGWKPTTFLSSYPYNFEGTIFTLIFVEYQIYCLIYFSFALLGLEIIYPSGDIKYLSHAYLLWQPFSYISLRKDQHISVRCNVM